MEKMAHIKPILCVFAKLCIFYSCGYTAPEMHHQQANGIRALLRVVMRLAGLIAPEWSPGS
jgi:hypothetical protein